MDHVSRQTRRKIMQAVGTTNTGAEKAVRSLVHRLGYRYSLRRTDLFYIALELARDLTGEMIPSLSGLVRVAEREVDQTQLHSCTERVLGAYRQLGGTDQVAKGPELKAALDAMRAEAA